MKCQQGEGKGRPRGLGRAGRRALSAGREGHSAPSRWSFLLLSGSVTSFRSKASLTEQAEEGGKAKQLRRGSASPIPPGVAGFILVLSSCSGQSYRHAGRLRQTFLPRLGVLTLRRAVQSPQQPPSKHPHRGAGTGAKAGAGSRGKRRGASLNAASHRQPAGTGGGWRQGDAEPGCERP